MPAPQPQTFRTYLDRLTGHRVWLFASAVAAAFALTTIGVFLAGHMSPEQFYVGIAAVAGAWTTMIGVTTATDAIRDVANRPAAPDAADDGPPETDG